MAGGEVIRGEWQFLRKDGSVFTGEVTARQLPDGRLRAILRDISERKLAEKAITTIIRRVRGESSEIFFSSMAYYLAECLSADQAFIGELIDEEGGYVRTIGACSHGKLVDNFTYKLGNTPCECLTDKGTCSYPTGVSRTFPKDALLREMNVEAYVGTPLFGAQGQPIGVMVALYCRPLENPALAEMILNLFSARTGAEIERKRTEDELRRVTARLHEANKELLQAKDRLTEEQALSRTGDRHRTWLWRDHRKKDGT